MADSHSTISKFITLDTGRIWRIGNSLEIYPNEYSGGVIDFHPSGRGTISYDVDFISRIQANGENGKIVFNYDDSATGGVEIRKGGLTVTAGDININSGTLQLNSQEMKIFGSSKGIYWHENSSTYLGEGFYLFGSFSGTGDSNKLTLQGSATNNGTPSWADVVTVAASSGNIWTKGTGSFGSNISARSGYIYATDGNLYAGNTAGTAERDVFARSGAGTIYLYAAGGTAGNRGIGGKNQAGTYGDILVVNQTNDVKTKSGNSNGTYLRNIQYQNSAGTSTASNYTIMRRLST